MKRKVNEDHFDGEQSQVDALAEINFSIAKRIAILGIGTLSHPT